jgi:hypothetical protein
LAVFKHWSIVFVTRDAGIATAHGVGGGGVGAEELLSLAAVIRLVKRARGCKHQSRYLVLQDCNEIVYPHAPVV